VPIIFMTQRVQPLTAYIKSLIEMFVLLASLKFLQTVMSKKIHTHMKEKY